MKVNIGGALFELPTKNLKSGHEVSYVDLLENEPLRSKIVALMGKEISRLDSDIQLIVVPEVKAILLGNELGKSLGIECYVARKEFINFIEISQARVSSYSSGANRFRYTLSENAKAKLSGKCIAVVDDVLTTGATVDAVVQACEEAGATVALSIVAFKEGDLAKHDSARFLHELDLPEQRNALENFTHFALTAREELPTVYTAMSKMTFCYRTMITKYVIDEGYAPFNPFMSFDFALHGLCEKSDVIKANNTMVSKCDELWHFGPVSDGSLAELIIAKDMGKQLKFFDIAKNWIPFEVPTDQIQVEEDRLVAPFNTLVADL